MFHSKIIWWKTKEEQEDSQFYYLVGIQLNYLILNDFPKAKNILKS
jgi:hypothetical protein